ncbi:hypothetical protein PSENEW3_00001334 [Picochlorum sp. SENEW3]|nr:hypothetical protein PSENEW3_00001334 [Picochlorum sp. SENEW3]
MSTENSLFLPRGYDTWEACRVSSLRRWVSDRLDEDIDHHADGEEDTIKTVRVGPSSTVELEPLASVHGGMITCKKNKVPSYLMDCGGMVWTMDWSPYDEEMTCLAVGCHPRGQHVHEFGRAYHGEASIQVWRVKDESIKNTRTAPEVEMAIMHEGGVTWSVCWCPAVESMVDGRIGLLAAVLGDGRVCVWDVPKNTRIGEECAPSMYAVDPIAEVPAGHVDGSLPCTVDWLPHAPYDLLLVGYQDGCVSIIKIIDEQEGGMKEVSMKVIQYFPSDVLPLSAALWFPSCSNTASRHRDAACEGEGIERYAFATVGDESVLNIWDSRHEYHPRVSVKTGTSFTIQDMCWTCHPLGIMMALEDGTVRGFLMEPEAMKRQLKSGRPISLITWRGNLPGAMWAIDASEPSVLTSEKNETIAYAGEDGVVGIMHDSKYIYASKRRQDTPHMPLVGLWCEGKNSFCIKSTRDLMEWKPFGGLSSGRAGDRKEAMKQTMGEMTDIAQAILCLKFSKRPAGCSQAKGQWLAYGNAAGLVH